jgi:hypothetical protein
VVDGEPLVAAEYCRLMHAAVEDASDPNTSG